MTAKLQIYAGSTEGMDRPTWMLSFSRITDGVAVHLGTICTEAPSAEEAFDQCVENDICPFEMTDDDQECMILGPVAREEAPDNQPFDVLMTHADMEALSLEPVRLEEPDTDWS